MEDDINADPPAQEEAMILDDSMDIVPDEEANENEEPAGVVKVSNISPQANLEQMKKLFGFLGDVQELALYPKGFVF